jgi:hypothetical protein
MTLLKLILPTKVAEVIGPCHEMLKYFIQNLKYLYIFLYFILSSYNVECWCFIVENNVVFAYMK